MGRAVPVVPGHVHESLQIGAELIPVTRGALADYELLNELGRGGTAVVYLAHNRATGAECAIKLIRAAYLEDEETLARFAREARFTARLEHPNIVPILDVLPLERGGLALVMPHVAGQTLKQVIRAVGPLSAERAEGVLRDAAAGLSAAHAIGVIHRDVKPENIFVDDEGHAFLADFGLARSMTDDTQLTMTGAAIGTPAYMPPEQIDGGVLDARGDVYSLGLVGWEMLTGRRPWETDSLYAVLYHQKHDMLPDVREFRPEVPDRFAATIAKAIEKEPEQRWQSVVEMLAALDGDVPMPVVRRVTPANSETVRFERGVPVRSAGPSGFVADDRSEALESEDISEFEGLAEMSPSPPPTRWLRREVVGSALAVFVGVVLVSAGLWQRAAAAPRRASQPSRTALTTGTSLRHSTPTTTPGVAPAPPALAEPHVSPTPPGSADSATPHAAAPSVGPMTPESDTRAAVPMRQINGDSAAAAAKIPASIRPTLAAPTSPALATPRVVIATGGMHTCLVTANARGYCWGENSSGQLGTGGTARASSPATIATESGLVSIAAGLTHTCALTSAGAAWCWGANDRGQLGDGSTAAHTSPARVEGEHTFRSVTAGAAHSCGIDVDGVVWCWGAGSHGQLGDGGTSDATTPVEVPGSRFTTVVAGWNFTCGLDTRGRAFCWGDNSAGQLGTGDSVEHRQPEPVSTQLTFVALAAGNAHACGVTADGGAYCWGQNSSGELGDGTTIGEVHPTRVKSAVSFASITAGARHTCAIGTGGAAYCWGLDGYGQLGDGGQATELRPVPVAGGHVFASVRAFGSHTCGTTVSGEAFCWGYNLDGQLGDGTRVNRSRPAYLEAPAVR